MQAVVLGDGQLNELLVVCFCKIAEGCFWPKMYMYVCLQSVMNSCVLPPALWIAYLIVSGSCFLLTNGTRAGSVL